MFDRFDEWNEDWLREEMAGVPPSVVIPTVAKKSFTSVVLEVMAKHDKFMTAREIAEIVGGGTNRVLSTLRGAAKSDKVRKAGVRNERIVWEVLKW